jgi:hypothetical protein
MNICREVRISGDTGEVLAIDVKAEKSVVKAQLTDDDIMALVRCLYDVSFLDLRDCYPSASFFLQLDPTTHRVHRTVVSTIEDVGCHTISLKIGTLSKTVRDFGGGPKSLQPIRRRLWELGGGLQ